MVRTRKHFLEAYDWLCKSRKKYPPSSDIWQFRKDWQDNSEYIINKFSQGDYQFGVQEKVKLSSGETVALWSASDALVIKVITKILSGRLKGQLSKSCYHLKNHGGLKGAVCEIAAVLPEYKFCCRTDIKSYYDSIDHNILLNQLYDTMIDQIITGYIFQFLNRTVGWGGLYQAFSKGIPKASSLSPILGALYLAELDECMEKHDVKYIRYMDDILILSKTRWKLRKAVRDINHIFAELKLEQHPDKTFIGRISKGFDFLGYHFYPDRVDVGNKTIENFSQRISRLYEQGASCVRIGEYVMRWYGWVRSGFDSKLSNILPPSVKWQYINDGCVLMSGSSTYSCQPENSCAE